MPRKDKAGYREYMKEYMTHKRSGLTEIKWWAVLDLNQ